MKLKDFESKLRKEVKKYYPIVNFDNYSQFHMMHDITGDLCAVILKKVATTNTLNNEFEINVLGVNDKGKLEHCYRSTVEFSIDKTTKVLTITNLMTRSGYEKRGYATELLTTIEDFAKLLKLDKIELYAYAMGSTGNLIDFYEQHGYTSNGKDMYKLNSKFKKLSIEQLSNLNFNDNNSYVHHHEETLEN